MGFDYMGMSYQEQVSKDPPAAIFAFNTVRLFILAALYESWSLPFSVLLVRPLPCSERLGILGREMVFNIYAQIGLIV
jgi:multidrug efflux pump subunit AcrB